MDLGDVVVSGLFFGLGWLASRFFAVAGRRTEASIDRGWTRVSKWPARLRSERAAARASQEQAANLSALERDRVGRVFIRHVSRDDPGMIGVVRSLHEREPGQRVLMLWSSPEGRTPQEDDYPTDQPIGIEWKVLVRSPADQVHHTARMILRELTDDNGWVEFEPAVE